MMPRPEEAPGLQPAKGTVWEVLGAATKLGVTSFGGPIAHLGYFHHEYVVRRQWLDEQTYSDVVALCQFLPGPASSQVGMAVGILRAGLPGALAAWLGFTLPSALLMVAFATGIGWVAPHQSAGWLHGLKVVAVAVVAQAVWSMAQTMCPDRARASLALAAAVTVLLWPGALGQMVTIAVAGLAGLIVLRPTVTATGSGVVLRYGRMVATVSLVLFFTLLAGLPVAAALAQNQALDVVDSFYRTGSLVFGGGHVVLPLLQAEVVPPGWITDEQFLAGYGAAQAVPGPLFTFAAYLGAVMTPFGNPWLGASTALAAIFMPSFLLVVGVLPFWNAIRAQVRFRAAVQGINAGVVGILLAALYHPVATNAIHRPQDFALALVAFALLTVWKLPPLVVVVATALGGALLSTG